MEQNIKNLDGLWSTVLKSKGCYLQGGQWNAGMIAGSAWPNRIWSADPDPRPDGLEWFLQNGFNRATVSLFGDADDSLIDTLDKYGYVESSSQTAMNLNMATYRARELSNRLEFKEVQSLHQAHKWTDLFEQAFNYQIRPEIILEMRPVIKPYIIHAAYGTAGTIMLYGKGDVLGIHGLGIVSSHRNLGIATDAMKWALNKTMRAGYSKAVLQASPVAEDMYKKLGFKPQQTIKNYSKIIDGTN